MKRTKMVLVERAPEMVELNVSYHIHLGGFTVFADEVRGHCFDSDGERVNALDFYKNNVFVGMTYGKFTVSRHQLETDYIFALYPRD